MYQDPIDIAIRLASFLLSAAWAILTLIVLLEYVGLIDLDVLGTIVRRCLEVAGE